MEEHVRKLWLTLAAGLAVLSTSALPSRAYGPKFQAGIQHAGLVCSHFWNGRWHPRQICVWTPQHRPYHHHHYPNYR